MQNEWGRSRDDNGKLHRILLLVLGPGQGGCIESYCFPWVGVGWLAHNEKTYGMAKASNIEFHYFSWGWGHRWHRVLLFLLGWSRLVGTNLQSIRDDDGE